ncbi:MAG: hypothetical protein Q7K43_05220, partial [Candidatus Woesearchaeota archaeon]|nr:hypothetical protein [Candidatus Woesearchaeota archaeon]
MKTTNVIKKMVAVGTGLAMVGATILGASAGTLADYPSPFVKAGMPAANLAVVVGDKAAAEDVLGVGDILGALQQAAVSTVATVSSEKKTTNWLQGDVSEIGSSGDLLELGEEINEVQDSFSAGDAKALASGRVTTDKGSTDYNQYIKFQDDAATADDDSQAGAVVFAKDEDDNVGTFLFWDGGVEVFQYELVFEEGFSSKIDSTNDLDDLEGEVLTVLGSQLTIVDADNVNAAEDGINLDLMTGSAKLVLEEGETKTVTIGDKEYTVNVKIVSETANAGEGSVSLVINGEATDELEDGDTDRLKDGTEIGVSDIIPTGKETQKSI